MVTTRATKTTTGILYTVSVTQPTLEAIAITIHRPSMDMKTPTKVKTNNNETYESNTIKHTTHNELDNKCFKSYK